MFLTDLPEDLLLCIWSFLQNNRDSISLLKTSKYLHNVGKINGYVKEISIKKLSPFDFLEKCIKHFHSITCIISDSVDWMPKIWPEKVIFVFAGGNKKIDPRNAVKTKELLIRVKSSRQKIQINFIKFPQLKKNSICLISD